MTESESVALPLGDTPLYQPSAGFDTWASWIRTSECRSQSPVPYRLAIAQYTIMQTAERKSARRDSNSRPSPWQGDALPLSHFRVIGGGRWIRTIESSANGFTVRPLWPLGNPSTYACLFGHKADQTPSNVMELVEGIEPPTC